MKKTLVAIGMLAFTVTGCDNAEEETPTTADNPPAAEAPATGGQAPAAAPAGGGDTNFGTVSLAAGFTDPHVVEGQSGGSTDASTLNAECVGNISGTPDHALELGADVPGLRIFAHADSDITLVVQKPDGTYLCNDDHDGTSPLVTAETFAAGTYRIWVGNYNSEEGAASYKLAFSTAETATPSQLAQ